MKKALLVLFCCFMPLVCNANNDYVWEPDKGSYGLKYKINDKIKQIWGYPTLNRTYIQDVSRDYGDFQIRASWVCCGDTWERAQGNFDWKTGYGRDDWGIMGLVAQNITEHGAEFCLTQIGVATSSSSFWLQHQQPHNPNLQCAWFCEPGWDGVACMEKTNPNLACNTTNYKAERDRISKAVYPDNDSMKVHNQRPGVAEYITMFDFGYINNVYNHEIVLGAVKFLDNGHGIEAKPILISAVGNHPVVSWTHTSGVANSVQKVLCAQGYTADDKCSKSSRNCSDGSGEEVWCSGYGKSNYNSSLHVKKANGNCYVFECKESDKAFDDKYGCIKCDTSAIRGRCNIADSNAFGKCVSCELGEFFNSANCTCEKARVLSKDMMQYGNKQASVAEEQCWTKDDLAKYKACLEEALK